MTQAAATEAQLRELDVAIDTAVSTRTPPRSTACWPMTSSIPTRVGSPNRNASSLRPPWRASIRHAASCHGLEVEPHGDVAVTRGTIEFIYTDARPNLYLGYVRVHRLLDSGWRAISHRSFYVADRA